MRGRPGPRGAAVLALACGRPRPRRRGVLAPRGSAAPRGSPTRSRLISSPTRVVIKFQFN
jgi:hypothetical protein